MQKSRPGRRNRLGNYAMITGLAILVICGFGALAVDTTLIRIGQSQSQDVADAASHAALLVLRKTGIPAEARKVAEAVVARNTIVGVPGRLDSIEYGTWDLDAHTFVSNPDQPNSIRVRVSRAGDNAVGLTLARIWGFDSVDVSARATAAGRRLQVVLVMDITNSWDHPDFHNAREAAVAFLDGIFYTAGPDDEIAMVVFSGRWGWEFTPFTPIIDARFAGGVRDTWLELETASHAGVNEPAHFKHCVIYGNNDFNSPLGGCFPDMPREYMDEYGTDHTVGMEMAKTMFSEEYDPAVYRAVILLTDGYPNTPGEGGQRAAAGYVEDRWRVHEGPYPHYVEDIRTDSIIVSQEMWAQYEAHTWVVSFINHEDFMPAMVQGDGAYYNVNSSAALEPVFEDIAESLPTLVVE
ncbi:MAG: hypothetical protein JRJ84_07480 [Deltaproteobacteria bacterium]|nr:hypothetical protein [Deltaproteobacteria bacterium]